MSNHRLIAFFDRTTRKEWLIGGYFRTGSVPSSGRFMNYELTVAEAGTIECCLVPFQLLQFYFFFLSLSLPPSLPLSLGFILVIAC